MESAKDLRTKGLPFQEKTFNMTSETAETLKTRGNAAFSAADFSGAIDLFSRAIALDPGSHVLYSNRSAAYTSKGDFSAALKDAEKTLELRADWCVTTHSLTVSLTIKSTLYNLHFMQLRADWCFPIHLLCHSYH